MQMNDVLSVTHYCSYWTVSWYIDYCYPILSIVCYFDLIFSLAFTLFILRIGWVSRLL